VNGSGSFDVQRGGSCKLRGGRCSFVMAHSGVSPGARGQPPYHPAMMVALLSYAFTQGLYASRRIAKACEERLDVMAVTGMQRPDFRTISDFRKRHLAALAGLFVQVLQLCRQAGLVSLGPVARRHQACRQRVEARGDELWPQAPGRGGAGERGRGVAGSGGARGRGGRRRAGPRCAAPDR